MIVIIAAMGTNLMSMENAIARLGFAVSITNDIDTIQKASHVILPGVGTSKMGMRQLAEHGLVSVVQQLSCPVLGVCLGMQLLYSYSEEDHTECLGVMEGRIRPLVAQKEYPCPHMGWNRLHWREDSLLSTSIPSNSYVYFVHSYAAEVSEYCLAETYYSQPIAAVVQKDNFFGMQFHPEKSAKVGAQLLKNFCDF